MTSNDNQTNPLTREQRIEEFISKGTILKDTLRGYDWQYRKKICTKCSVDEQARRKCFRVDNFKMIGGIKVQETHCKWMDKARVAKFHDEMLSFMGISN